MARIAGSTTSGVPTLIAPPESLTLFPSLASDLPSEARGEDPEELQAVKSKLDPESMWMIAIEASETGNTRMTMANSLLNDPQAMIELLAVLSKI